jgi:hypothetical protein
MPEASRSKLSDSADVARFNWRCARREEMFEPIEIGMTAKNRT